MGLTVCIFKVEQSPKHPHVSNQDVEETVRGKGHVIPYTFTKELYISAKEPYVSAHRTP